MKPPPFRYHDPTTVDEVTRVLAEVGPGGKVLAGGQSLLPLLNMRLAAPSDLVDINGVAGLDMVEVIDGGVRIGAGVRQRTLERHAAARAANPLLGDALPLVAHPVIRNRGTVVGSIAHADPAAELTAVLALTDGWVETAVHGGPGRRVAARDWFLGPLEADLHTGELVVAVGFGALPAGAGTAFVELSRRHGDYAMCGIAAVVEVDGGAVTRARVATISVHPTPLVVDVTDQLVDAPTPGDPARPAPAAMSVAGDAPASDGDPYVAAGAAVAARVDVAPDLHATSGYRRHLTRVLTARALRQAHGRAHEAGGPTPDAPTPAATATTRGG